MLYYASFCSGSSKNSSNGDSTVVKEPAPKSTVSAKKSSEQKKSDTADFLDELFGDPSTISKDKSTAPSGNSSSSSSRKVHTKETVSDSKESSAVVEPSAPSQPTLDLSTSASTQPPADVKEEDTVKSKVKKEDSENSEKVGSTNKPRRLPGWLADVTGHIATGASSTSSSKAPASRKRKAPSSASASSTAKRTKAASPTDESKDGDILPSPPPPKKVCKTVCLLLIWIHFQLFTCTCN